MADKRNTEHRTGVPETQRGLEQSREQGRELARRRDPFEGFGFGPFEMMRRWHEDIDRFFAGFGSGQGWLSPFGQREPGDWRPAIEAFHRGNEFVVRADVPGLSREDLTVEVGDDALTIQGERKYDRQEEREGVFRSERGYGSFCRVVPLPEGALTDSAKANFKDGVLEVVIQAPSQEVRRGRRIEIGQASEQRQQKP
jgi:HSP20 family protein